MRAGNIGRNIHFAPTIAEDNPTEEVGCLSGWSLVFPQDIKLVLCLTDGACNDAKLGKEICRALRGKVEVIGIPLDPDEHTRAYVADMFGEDRIIAYHSEELPQKLGNILRAIQSL